MLARHVPRGRRPPGTRWQHRLSPARRTDAAGSPGVPGAATGAAGRWRARSRVRWRLASPGRSGYPHPVPAAVV